MAIINQQKAFTKKNNLPVKLVKQLETLVIGNQIALCSKQKEVTNYFKSFSQSPKPNDVYKTLDDVLRDITIVELLSDSTLDMNTMELDAINTTITSGAMNALLRNEVTPGRISTPKCNKLEMSALTTTPKKKLKLSGAAARDKLMAMTDSSLYTELDSQLIVSSQE